MRKLREPARVRFANVGEDLPLDFGELPHTVQRRVTDLPCCAIFAAALAVLGYIVLFAWANGDTRRFLGLPDTDGRFCGVSEGFEDLPYLYYCRGQDVPGPSVCVSECPDPKEGEASAPAGKCPGIADYPSRPFSGLLCVPKDEETAARVSGAWTKPAVSWLLHVGNVCRHWELVLASAGAAALLGFLYLFVIEECGTCIGCVGVITVVAALASFGIYLMNSSTRLGADGLPGTGDAYWDLLLGVLLCAVSLCFACTSCYQADRFGNSLLLVQEASECIGDMRTLLFQPVVQVLIKGSLLAGLAFGFLRLASCTRFVPDSESDGRLLSLEFDPEDFAFFGYYAFMSLWLLEMCGAHSQFVISYVTQIWFFEQQLRGRIAPPLCPVCRGYLVGCTYHLGTLAYGSFVLLFTRVPRDLMLFCSYESNNGNDVSICCGCCCRCCVQCMEKCLKFMTRNAYMDTAINSNDFCKSAYHSGMVLMHYSQEVAALNCATVIFQIAGFGGIAATGGMLTHVLSKRVPRYSDPGSPQFVECPLAVDAVAALASAMVAWPFMVLLDQVSDTLVFCNALKKMRTPPPATLSEESEYEDLMENCTGCLLPPSRGLPFSNNGGVYAHYPESQALLPRY